MTTITNDSSERFLLPIEPLSVYQFLKISSSPQTLLTIKLDTKYPCEEEIQKTNPLSVKRLKRKIKNSLKTFRKILFDQHQTILEYSSPEENQL